jgi:hypothetical protein
MRRAREGRPCAGRAARSRGIHEINAGASMVPRAANPGPFGMNPCPGVISMRREPDDTCEVKLNGSRKPIETVDFRMGPKNKNGSLQKNGPKNMGPFGSRG